MDTTAGHEKCAAARAAQAPHWRAALRAEWSRPRCRRDVVRLLAWVYLLVALTIPIIRITSSFPPLALPFALVPALAVILWVAPRQDHFRTWLLYAVGMIFFTQLRDAADETLIPASTGYVLHWELWMFAGTTPSAWLQEHLGGASGDPGALAYLSTFLHWTWFFFPHLTVIGTYMWARPMFFRVAAIMLGVFYTGVAMYYLIPTVPPWLAVEEGDTTGIVRIMRDVGPRVFGQALWDDLYTLAAEANPRAAMPSLHFAAAFQIFLIALILRRGRLVWAGVVYSVGLGFALVYLGEHYFADIIVGGLAALVSCFIVERIVRGPGLRWSVRRRWRLRPPRRRWRRSRLRLARQAWDLLRSGPIRALAREGP
ncbi:MAG: inositol phosphorylceramide synthase [Chloroflexi bacterium]|nr:inositol phosphorylceramide synthase [Chloroflexota bacterium]